MQWSQCPYCGSQIAPHLSQCPVCGNSLIGEKLPVYGEEPEPQPTREPEPVRSEPRHGESAVPPIIYHPSRCSFLATLILGLFTLGIYPAIVANDIARDLNTICYGDGRRTPGGVEFFVLGWLTIGIYAIVWECMVADRVQANGPRYGYANAPGGVVMLVLDTVGLLLCMLGPLIAWYLLLDEVNTINESFSRWLVARL